MGAKLGCYDAAGDPTPGRNLGRSMSSSSVPPAATSPWCGQGSCRAQAAAAAEDREDSCAREPYAHIELDNEEDSDAILSRSLRLESLLLRRIHASRCTNTQTINQIRNTQVHDAHQLGDQLLQFVGDGMWPAVKQALRKFVLGDLQDLIRSECAELPQMKKFRFTACEFGDQKPVLGPLIVRSENDEGIEFCLGLVWQATGSHLECEVAGIRAGLRDISLRGTVLITLMPLAGVLPITCGFGLTFPDAPKLDWTWTGVCKALHYAEIRETIAKALFSSLVVPNRIYVDIAESAGLSDMDKTWHVLDYRSPPPLGVLRLELVQARDLCPRDVSGTSDPYAVVEVGSAKYVSRVVHRSLNPVWCNYDGADFTVYHLHQRVAISLWDKDRFSQDEFLGDMYDRKEDEALPSHRPRNPRHEAALQSPSVEALINKPDQWWPLDVSKLGKHAQCRSHLQLRCRYLMVDPDAERLMPRLVNCPKHCGLQPCSAKKSCALCEQSSSGWTSQLFNRSGSPKEKWAHCESCNYTVCAECMVMRRPACGLMRVVLRSAHVPGEDADTGVRVSVAFENHSFSSAKSRRVFEGAQPYLDKVAAVNNLHWHAKLDPETIGRCLGMSQLEVEHVLDKRRKSHSVPELRRDAFKKADPDSFLHEVLFEEAFHFPVRDPGPSNFLKFEYKVAGTRRFAWSEDRTLRGSMPLSAALPEKVTCVHATCNAAGGATSLPRFEASGLTWQVRGKNQQTVKLHLDVRLEPLREVDLRDPSLVLSEQSYSC